MYFVFGSTKLNIHVLVPRDAGFVLENAVFLSRPELAPIAVVSRTFVTCHLCYLSFVSPVCVTYHLSLVSPIFVSSVTCHTLCHLVSYGVDRATEELHLQLVTLVRWVR